MSTILLTLQKNLLFLFPITNKRKCYDQVNHIVCRSASRFQTRHWSCAALENFSGKRDAVFQLEGWRRCNDPKRRGSSNARQAHGFRARWLVWWKVWKCSSKTEPRGGLHNWRCPCRGANFIVRSTMVRNYICRANVPPWGRQTSVMLIVEDNMVDPVLSHSYRFSFIASFLSKRTQARPSQMINLRTFVSRTVIYWGTEQDLSISQTINIELVSPLKIIYYLWQLMVFSFPT